MSNTAPLSAETIKNFMYASTATVSMQMLKRGFRNSAVNGVRPLNPNATRLVGPAYTLLAFIIVITGGLGSMPGALIGGVMIGLTEAMAGLLFTPSAKSMFSFAILVLVLLFRPQGILGKKVA